MTDRTPGRDRGFTMIEMIIIIAVIATLASIAVPLVFTFEDRALSDATRAEMSNLRQGIEAWYEDRGAFPGSLDSLETEGYLGGNFSTAQLTEDEWGRTYTYDTTGFVASITSDGIDRTGSTTDDIVVSADVTPIVRSRTRDEIATIRVALRNYESIRVTASLPSLPNHWLDSGPTDGAWQMLVDQGLLPNDSDFLTDGWGASYQYAGTPSDAVTSTNLGGS